MYEENVKRINWTKNILKIILLILVVILSVKLVNLIISRQSSGKYDKKYNALLKKMDDYANDYFTLENIPQKSGISDIIYLEELIASKKINNVDSCDVNKSYIKAVRLDTEYEIKTYLICDNYENSINSFKKINNDVSINPSITTTMITKKVTTKNKLKKYKIAFNPNGGSLIDGITISANQKVSNIPTPTREGYKFVGWYYHGSQFDFNKKIKQDYVLIAKWVKE